MPASRLLHPAAPAGWRDPARCGRCARRRHAAGQQARIESEARATGILEISAWNQANALRQITVQRGLDVRDFTLTTFGGSGSRGCCAASWTSWTSRPFWFRQTPATFRRSADHSRREERLRPDPGRVARAARRRGFADGVPRAGRAGRRCAGRRGLSRGSAHFSSGPRTCGTSARHSRSASRYRTATWTSRRSTASRAPSTPSTESYMATTSPATQSSRSNGTPARLRHRSDHASDDSGHCRERECARDRAPFEPTGVLRRHGRVPPETPVYWRPDLRGGQVGAGPAILEEFDPRFRCTPGSPCASTTGAT